MGILQATSFKVLEKVKPKVYVNHILRDIHRDGARKRAWTKSGRWLSRGSVG